MTKITMLLATVCTAFLPTLAAAECSGIGHEKVTMSCAAGTVWDAEAQRCVTSTS